MIEMIGGLWKTQVLAVDSTTSTGTLSTASTSVPRMTVTPVPMTDGVTVIAGVPLMTAGVVLMTPKMTALVTAGALPMTVGVVHGDGERNVIYQGSAKQKS